MGDRAPRGSRTHRLSADVRPRHYHIHLHVSPDRSPRFSGRVTIALDVGAPQRVLCLHAADLAIVSASCEAGGVTSELQFAEPRASGLLKLKKKGGFAAGPCEVRLEFRGRLRHDLRGLYFVAQGDHRYAFTQLQATDARRVFPCFDEPEFKARFALQVTTSRANTVVSNEAIARTISHDDGQKTVVFENTALLSTYLLALAVGPLERSRVIRGGRNRTPISIYHAPGQAHLTRFGLNAARDCLGKLEDYFDLAYPYSKLDLLAVPDFEIGAMENAGAVFFREPLLLLDEGSATLPESKRAMEVICHELSHMWFGNLVTMEWWDDLWLNEAFATWLAFAIVAELRPGWRMWNDFIHGRNAALELDALGNTHAIYAPIHTAEQATESFDLITYEKGAAVVRMIEHYLGKETFQRGVRSYIRKHAEGNAVASDLWSALQDASGEAKLGALIRAWITQPGFPFIEVTLGPERGGQRRLQLRQERFYAGGPEQAEKARAKGDKSVWPIPWVGRIGTASETYTERSTLGEKSLTRSLPEATFIYGNAEEGGFFRPLHGEQELSTLASAVDRLTSTERLGLISHSFAFAYAGYTHLEPFLRLLAAFGKERDPDVLQACAVPLDRTLGACTDSVQETAVRAHCVEIWGPQLDELGLQERRRDNDVHRLLRAVLYDLVGRVGRREDVLADAQRRALTYLNDPSSVEPNLATPITLTAAIRGDGDLFARFVSASTGAPTPQQRRLFRLSLAEFEQPSLVQKLHRLYPKPIIPTQDVALVMARQFQNRAAQPTTWAYLTTHWESLEKRLTPSLAGRLIGATSALPPGMAKEVVAFFRAHPVPTAQRAVAQLQERFRHKTAFARHARPDLRKLSSR